MKLQFGIYVRYFIDGRGLEFDPFIVAIWKNSLFLVDICWGLGGSKGLLIAAIQSYHGSGKT